MPSAICPVLQYFSTLSHKRHDFKRKNSYFMEWSPSCEANRFSASGDIPSFLWNLTVHYRIHNCPPPVPILNQINPVHTPTSHFLKIHLNIIFPSMPGSYKWFLFFMFPYRNSVYTPPLPRTSCMCVCKWVVYGGRHPMSKGSWDIGGSESHKKGEKPGHRARDGKEGRKITQNGRGSAGPALGVPVETRWCCSLNVFCSELFGYWSDIILMWFWPCIFVNMWK